jgi:hypothetical protein
MGLKRRGRYPAHSVSAFEITRFSGARIGAEKVPSGATGGGNGPRNEPSLFFRLFSNALRMARCSCARGRQTSRVMTQRQECGLRDLVGCEQRQRAVCLNCPPALVKHFQLRLRDRRKPPAGEEPRQRLLAMSSGSGRARATLL